MNQTSKFNTGCQKERRSYARVLDAVGLEVRRLEPGELVDLSNSDSSLSAKGSSWQPYKAIEALHVSNPSAAQHIEKLESLLRLHSGADEVAGSRSAAPTHKVSISGSGIAFAHNLLLQPGDNVVLGLTLFPSQECFQVLAMIISAGGSAGPVSGGKHSARAMFSDIDVETREKIVKHIAFVHGEMQ